MSAETIATTAQVVAETAKASSWFTRHLDKAVAVAKAHPVAAVAVGVVGAAAIGWGGYKGAKAVFGSKPAASAKPAEAPKAEAQPEAPKEEAAAK